MNDTFQNFSNDKWVTESALIERINERLTDDSRSLKDLMMADSPSFGHFYDQPEGVSEQTGPVDIEAVGREMGVLAPDESVARDAGPRSGGPVKNKLVLE
jgi:hypothetical protein